MKLIADVLEPQAAHVKLAGLRGSSPAFIVTRLLEKLSAPFFAVMPDNETAEEFYREARFYSERPQSIYYFPSWETSPFEQSSPHPDISGERLNTLAALLEGKASLVVLPVSALMQRVLPRSVLADHSQYLVVGEEIDRDAFLRKLVDLGYSMVPLVEDRGSASVRGGIVDMYLPSLANPVRIEFFGDFVESIRTFDPVYTAFAPSTGRAGGSPFTGDYPVRISCPEFCRSFESSLRCSRHPRNPTKGTCWNNCSRPYTRLVSNIFSRCCIRDWKRFLTMPLPELSWLRSIPWQFRRPQTLFAVDFFAAEKRAEEKNAIICAGERSLSCILMS